MDSEPLLTNDRAKREWIWLCRRVGEEAVREAIARLPGARKAFPLNIARQLQIELPEEKYLPDLPGEAEAIHAKSRQVLGDALKMLSGKR